MTLQSPLVARERMLFYGEPGTGKTRAYLDIARFLQLTKTPGIVRVFDNDKSVMRMMENMDLNNVEVAEVYDWPEYMDTLKQWRKVITRDDWLVCDLMSETWQAVQSYYTEQVFGQDIGSYFLQLKKEMQSGNEFGGWTDWKYINKLYFDFTKPFVYASPCHVVGVSSASSVASKTDDKETVSIFGRVGFRPEGQKRLKHQFNTTIYFHKTGDSHYRYTSVKDRERPLQIASDLGTDDAPKSFAREYLMGVAGWKISA